MDMKDDEMVKLVKEVKNLRREMDEMKELLRSLLQTIMEKDSEEDEIYDYN